MTIYTIENGSVLWGQIINSNFQQLIAAGEGGCISFYTSAMAAAVDSYPSDPFFPPKIIVPSGGSDQTFTGVEVTADMATGAGATTFRIGNNLNPGASGFEYIDVTLASGSRTASLGTGSITFDTTNSDCVIRVTSATGGHSGISVRLFPGV